MTVYRPYCDELQQRSLACWRVVVSGHPLSSRSTVSTPRFRLSNLPHHPRVVAVTIASARLHIRHRWVERHQGTLQPCELCVCRRRRFSRHRQRFLVGTRLGCSRSCHVVLPVDCCWRYWLSTFAAVSYAALHVNWCGPFFSFGPLESLLLCSVCYSRWSPCSCSGTEPEGSWCSGRSQSLKRLFSWTSQDRCAVLVEPCSCACTGYAPNVMLQNLMILGPISP